METSPTLTFVAGLRPGDELCAIHAGEGAEERLLATFLESGLAAGDKVLYLGPPEAVEAALAGCRELGVDVEDATAGGRLEVSSECRRRSREGLDVEAFAEHLETRAASALADGFRALRLAAEMGWLLGELAGEDLAGAADRLSRLVEGGGLLALWRYDRRCFEPAALLDAVAAQPRLVVAAELYEGFGYLPSEDFLTSDWSTSSLDRWLELLDERRRAPAAEGKTESLAPHLLRTILESLGDGIVVTDAEGLPLRFNPAAARTLGRGPMHLAPERWPERYGLRGPNGGAFLAAEELPLCRALAGRTVDRAEVLAERPGDGGRVWLSISARPLIDGEGELRGAVLVLRDITRRKQAEENLRESQARLELLNQISTTFTSGMSVQRVIECAVKPISGHFPHYRIAYSTIDVEGRRRVRFALAPDGMPPATGGDASLVEAPDYLAELRTGHQVRVSDVAEDARTAPLAALFAADGVRARLDEPLYHSEKLVGVLSLESPHPESWRRHESLTLRQTVEYLALAINDARAQEERRWAEQALRRSNEELRAFAHSISHDLKAPLRAIQGFSEALVEDYGELLDEGAHRYLKFITDGATRMGELIEDLLQHARLGRDGVRLAPVDMREVAARVVQSLTRAIEESGADVRIEANLPTVIGHRSTLELMLQNLVGNALKFVAPGQEPKVVVGARSNRTSHRIYVRDRGIGIDPKYHEGIFNIFHRLHSPAAFPGTGIGLAIVKKGATLHEGDVFVESEPGRGSTFSFTIPKKPKGSHGS